MKEGKVESFLEIRRGKNGGQTLAAGSIKWGLGNDQGPGRGKGMIKYDADARKIIRGLITRLHIDASSINS